ncbi:MAG: LPS assembly lipoprotein LptE [Pseudomonadota bacterium]
MSSFDRRACLLSLTALAGCGFSPIFATGPEAQGSTLRGRIDVAPPKDEEGFALVKRLEDRLGLPQAPDLSLTADIRLREQVLGFLPDGEISRVNVIGQVNWQLVSIAGNDRVASGSERSFTSYSSTSTTVATTFAQRDARRRLMVILADRIVTDLFARDIS